MKKILLVIALCFSWVAQAAVIIDLYGDSTQLGAELVDGVYISTAKPPSAVLQDRMDAEFGPGSVVVRNKALGGTTVAQQYFGQAPYTRTWAAEMAASNANIVIDNHGINDAFLSYMRPADYLWVQNTMSAVAQAKGKKYYIQTPFPINNPAQAKLTTFVNAAHAGPLVAGTKILYIHNIVSADWSYWAQQMPDGIHPNAELYRYAGDRMFYTLQPVVKTMLGRP